MDLGKNIQYFRIKNNLTQEQLSDKLDVSRQTIYKWETGMAIPRGDNIMNLVQLFNITYDQLFYGVSGKPSNKENNENQD